MQLDIKHGLYGIRVQESKEKQRKNEKAVGKYINEDSVRLEPDVQEKSPDERPKGLDIVRSHLLTLYIYLGEMQIRS